MKLTILLLSIPLSYFFTSCSSYSEANSPVLPSYSVASSYETTGVSRAKGLSESSQSTQSRIITKSADIDMEVSEIKSAGEKFEQIVLHNKGYITSMNRTESNTHYASYNARIPAATLVDTVEEIKTLGDIDYLKIWVDDQTEDAVKLLARLKELKTRRDRFSNMLRGSSKTADKIKIEKILSELEAEIFQIELAQQQLMKHSGYSKLSISFDRKSIRGPIGTVLHGLSWSVDKLFTIRE